MRARRLAVAFLMVAAAARASDTSLADHLKSARETVEKIRGRTFRSPVAAEEISPDRLRSLIDEKLRGGLPVAPDVYFRTLAAIGAIDRADLKGLFPKLLDFYGRQVLAFYDPESGKFFIARDAGDRAGNAASVSEDLILIHELTHALQDQYMKLQPRLEELKDDGDAALALECVLEGEATEVMIEAAVASVPGAEDAVDAALFTSSLVDLDPESGKVPAFFAEQLFFPYSDGTAFIRGIRKRDGWKAVDRLWEAPPTTTAAILHPDPTAALGRTILEGDNAPPSGYRLLYSDTIGEWTIRFLLRRWSSPSADSRAASWKGDRFSFYEHGSEIAFRGHVRFSDPDVAEAVAAAWRKAVPAIHAETHGSDLSISLGFERPEQPTSPRPSDTPLRNTERGRG